MEIKTGFFNTKVDTSIPITSISCEPVSAIMSCINSSQVVLACESTTVSAQIRRPINTSAIISAITIPNFSTSDATISPSQLGAVIGIKNFHLTAYEATAATSCLKPLIVSSSLAIVINWLLSKTHAYILLLSFSQILRVVKQISRFVEAYCEDLAQLAEQLHRKTFPRILLG